VDPAIYQLIEGLRTRLDQAESQLALLSEKAGVPYDPPGKDVSPQVRALVVAGKRLDAITQLRAETGLPLADAKAIIDKM